MANAKETRSVKNNIGLALFILILVAMFFIPTSETLTAAGRNSLGLLLATIVCMLTGGLPSAYCACWSFRLCISAAVWKRLRLRWLASRTKVPSLCWQALA